MDIKTIQEFLKNRANKKAKESWKKFVPTSKKLYGTYISEVNKIVHKCYHGGFGLVNALWKSGYLEEKILAAKILAKISQDNPTKALETIEKFSRDISDWAVCDTLAGQGIREIIKKEPKEVFNLAQRLLSKNFWQRRLAIVILIELKKQNFSQEKIEKTLKKVENDSEYYVKKAIIWAKKEFKK